MWNLRGICNLEGKVAVVTGSTSGIGKAIAEALAEVGANIVLNGRRSPADVEDQRQNLEKTRGIQAIYHPADMTKSAEVKGLIAKANERFGGVDILVNNAGVQKVSPVEQFPEDMLHQILDVNLKGAFFAIQAAVPHMKKKGWGRIINIGSAHSATASPNKIAYVAAKHGLEGIMKVMAVELGSFGITCNDINPGYVDTPLVRGQIADQAKSLKMKPEDIERNVFLAPHATGKFTTHAQIGGAAVFLCSTFADNINGLSMFMDGGWTAGRVPQHTQAQPANVQQSNVHPLRPGATAPAGTPDIPEAAKAALT